MSCTAAADGVPGPGGNIFISITTRLVDTDLITQHFKLDEITDAYDTFGRAAETHALKVIIGV
jgi:threonine dehydrogenase-like Zn-dependent dehydrogenase